MITELLIGAGVFAVLGVVSIAGWAVGTYNGFQIFKQNIATQFSNILAEYQRRADLFYNLAESVKSYKIFEKGTFVELAAARAGKFGDTKPEQLKKLKGLDGFFGRLMAVMENYPQLRASELYAELNEELKTTENRINIARTEYNDIVREYNTLIKVFPSNILAGWFAMVPEHFFEAEVGAMKAPRLSL